MVRCTRTYGALHKINFCVWIQCNRDHVGHGRTKPRCTSAQLLIAAARFPFPDNRFDIVYASHVLEHMVWYRQLNADGMGASAQARRCLGDMGS